MFIKRKGYVLLETIIIIGVILTLVLLINKLIISNYARVGEYQNRILETQKIIDIIPIIKIEEKINYDKGSKDIEEYLKEEKYIEIDGKRYKLIHNKEKLRITITFMNKSYWYEKSLKYIVKDDKKIKFEKGVDK